MINIFSTPKKRPAQLFVDEQTQKRAKLNTKVESLAQLATWQIENNIICDLVRYKDRDLALLSSDFMKKYSQLYMDTLPKKNAQKALKSLRIALKDHPQFMSACSSITLKPNDENQYWHDYGPFNDLAYKILEQLPVFAEIKTLVLKGSNISDVSLMPINWQCMTNLCALDLSHNSNFAANVGQNLHKLAQLTSLNLMDTGIGFTYLHNAEFTNLRSLTISMHVPCTNIQGTSLRALSTLTALNIHSNQSFKIPSAISCFLPLPSLQSLYLENMAPSDYQHLTTLTSLVNFSFNYNANKLFSNSQLKLLYQLSTLTQLKTLSLKEITVSRSFIASNAMDKLHHLSQLEYLTLKVSVTYTNMLNFAEHLPNLKSLDLGNIDQDKLSELKSVTSSLRHLSIAVQMLAHAEFPTNPLKRFTKLQSLAVQVDRSSHKLSVLLHRNEFSKHFTQLRELVVKDSTDPKRVFRYTRHF